MRSVATFVALLSAATRKILGSPIGDDPEGASGHLTTYDLYLKLTKVPALLLRPGEIPSHSHHESHYSPITGIMESFRKTLGLTPQDLVVSFKYKSEVVMTRFFWG